MPSIVGKPIYQSFISCIPVDICQHIILAGDELEQRQGTILKSDGEFGESLEKRNTQIAFWDEWHWINGIMAHYIAMTNRQIWQFDVSVSEGVQYGVYGQGCYYGWHSDTYTDHVIAKDGSGDVLNRLVSATLNLSPSEDYDGGNLMFKDASGVEHEIPEFRKQGSLIVFPSELEHKVTEVTRGVRKSCVSWILGYPD